MLAAARRVQAEQLDLIVAELGRHLDDGTDPQVTAAASLQAGHTAAAQHELAAGLGTGRHLQLLVAVECLQGEPGAERRLGDRDRQLGDEVVVLAAVAIVRAGSDVDVQVAGRTSAGPDGTTTGEPQRGARVDAGRDVDLIRLFGCLLYTSPSPRDRTRSRMPSSA